MMSPNGVELELELADVEAERAVLGSMIIDRDAVLAVAPIINSAKAFFDVRHQVIYQTIIDLFDARVPIDLQTLESRLHREQKLEPAGGATYLAELATSVLHAVHADHYAWSVRDWARRRWIYHSTLKVAEEAVNHNKSTDELIDFATDLIQKSSRGTNAEFVTANQASKRFMASLEKAEDRIIPTGFHELDLTYLAGGLRPGQLVTIAARTGRGKTALALQMLHHNAVKHGRSIGFLSLEMNIEQVWARLVAIEGKIDMQSVRTAQTTGEIDDDQYQAITNIVGRLSNSSIVMIDTRSITINNLAARAIQLHALYDIDCLIVDYMQLIRGKTASEGRHLEVADVSRRLKALALELEIPIIALAQLNREVVKRGSSSTPDLTDIRESDAIAHDSDIVMFIHHIEQTDEEKKAGYMPKARLIIGKHRDGREGSIELYWKAETAQFLNATRG